MSSSALKQSVCQSKLVNNFRHLCLKLNDQIQKFARPKCERDSKKCKVINVSITSAYGARKSSRTTLKNHYINLVIFLQADRRKKNIDKWIFFRRSVYVLYDVYPIAALLHRELHPFRAPLSLYNRDSRRVIQNDPFQ